MSKRGRWATMRFTLFLAPAFALFIAACGGSAAIESTDGGKAAAGSAIPSVEEVAAANIPLLETSDNPLDIEVLSVVDGSVASLRDAVDGDRPVLLWFYAPH